MVRGLCAMLDEVDRRSLLAVAYRAIEQQFHRQHKAAGNIRQSAALLEKRASFVTLKRDGQLRGCIGTLEPVRQLCDDVAYNAQAAAFRDPRFPPLLLPETENLRIEISVLGKPELLSVSDRRALLDCLRPGLDGLIVEAGSRCATFLPSVWESLADPDEFVTCLWKKAGMSPDNWPPGMRLLRYAAEHFTASSDQGS